MNRKGGKKEIGNKRKKYCTPTGPWLPFRPTLALQPCGPKPPADCRAHAFRYADMWDPLAGLTSPRPSHSFHCYAGPRVNHWLIVYARCLCSHWLAARWGPRASDRGRGPVFLPRAMRERSTEHPATSAIRGLNGISAIRSAQPDCAPPFIARSTPLSFPLLLIHAARSHHRRRLCAPD